MTRPARRVIGREVPLAACAGISRPSNGRLEEQRHRDSSEGKESLQAARKQRQAVERSARRRISRLR